MTANRSSNGEPVFSTDLPEPTLCVLDGDGECLTWPTVAVCSCKWFCGEGSEAGCCYCCHADIYEPCPRGGGWCDSGLCGDPDSCCSPAERAFVAEAQLAWALDHQAVPS